MSKHLSYTLKGASCYNCVLNIKKLLEPHVKQYKIEDINIDPTKTHLHIRTGDESLLDIKELNLIFEDTKFSLSLPQPLTLFEQYFTLGVVFITSAAAELILSEIGYNRFQIFMAFWLILFGILKLQDTQAFAKMFAKYDILAKRFKLYGKVFPWIELVLGLYLLSPAPHVFAYFIMLPIFGVTAFSVLKVIFSKQSVACACLGANSKMQVGYVTLIENALMIFMAVFMIANFW